MESAPEELYCLCCRKVETGADGKPVLNPGKNGKMKKVPLKSRIVPGSARKARYRFRSKKGKMDPSQGKVMERTVWLALCADCGREIRAFTKSDKEKDANLQVIDITQRAAPKTDMDVAMDAK